MNVKFNKHRIFIIFSLMFLLIVVSVLCSFAPPSFSSTVDSFSNLNQSEVDLIFSVFGHMDELGYFTGSIPVLCYYSSNLSIVRLICIKPGDTYELSSTGITTSTGSTFRYELTADGFCLKTLITNSTISFTSSRVLFSRSTVNDPFVINSSFAFASGSNARDSLVDMASYWYDLYNIVLNYEDNLSSAVSEAYSEGLATGQGEGFDIGLEQGYNQGYDSGFADGEDRGYIEGQTEGYSDGFSEGYSEGESVGSASGYRDGFDDGQVVGFNNGYESGYDDGYKRGDDVGYQNGYSDGYDEGYSEGYETGLDHGSDSDYHKPGQIFARFWRYVDDSDYQGIMWFCTISHNGVSAFRWCTEDEIYSHYLNCEVYDYVYDTNLYFQKNPLEFNYFVPQLVREESPYSGALSIKSVEYRFVDLYNQRAVIELGYDASITQLLNSKYNEGIRDSNALVNGVSNIASKPIKSLKEALDFEIFGINIGSVAVGLVAILFAIWAYNKIRKILPI